MENLAVVVHFLGVFCRFPFEIKKIVKIVVLKGTIQKAFRAQEETPWNESKQIRKPLHCPFRGTTHCLWGKSSRARSRDSAAPPGSKFHLQSKHCNASQVTV